MSVDRAKETIDTAVQDAINAGMSPADFVEAAREYWGIYLRDKADTDDRQWREMTE